MTGKISLTYSPEGEAILSFRTFDKNEARAIYHNLKDENVAATFKKYRPARSLDANAYAWVLINKLAEATGLPPKTIYRESIRDIGGSADVLCMLERSVDEFISRWESKGLGWQAEKMPSKIEGCVNVMAYAGSSTYDTRQMSQLIDALIGDCKEFGIETLPPDKISGLLETWNGKRAM